MKRIYYFFLSIILVGTLTHCVVSKPDAYSATLPDYNQRQDIYGAHYTKRLTTVGGLTIAGAAAAGGYLGYNNNHMFHRQNGIETQSLRSLNAAAGALVGITITSFVNYAVLGQGSKQQAGSSEHWIKRVDKNMIDLGTTGAGFRAIHRSSEMNYQVRNYTDVEDFGKAFPSSRYKDDLVQKSAAPGVLSQEQLLKVISKYPEQPSSIMLKKRYVSQSRTLSDYFYACDQFPETKPDIELIARDYIKTQQDIPIFANRFPSSKYAFDIFGQFKDQYTAVVIWMKSFPNHEKTREVKIYCLKSFTGYDIKELQKMNTEYNILKLDDVFADNYEQDLATAKKIHDRLIESQAILGEDYVSRSTENIKAAWLKQNLPGSEDSSQKIKDFIDLLIENKWLSPVSNTYEGKLKQDLAVANKREEDERERARLAEIKQAEEKKANMLSNLKKAIETNDIASITLYVVENGFRPEIEEQLTFDEQLVLAKMFDPESRKEMLWNKLGYWKEYDPFLSVYPQYSTKIEELAFSNLQKRAEERNWCYSCCEIYLRLFPGNIDRRKNVEEWRKFAHEHEIADKNLEAAKKLEAASKAPTQSYSSSSSSQSNNGPKICSYCAGRGREVCSSCDGTGIRTSGWSDERETCDSCNGAGYKKCHSCDGRGTRN